MTGFVTKKITRRSRTLGSILKSARTKANITFEQAEKQTHIHPKYLRALEEGAYGQLPADAYNVGFVRVYASLLKLPVDRILALYKQERSQFHYQTGTKNILAPRRAGEWRFFVTPKFIGILGAVALFGGIAAYIVLQLRSFTQPPKLSITNLPAEFTSSQGIVHIEGMTADGAILTMNTEAVHVAPDGRFIQDVQLRPGVNDIVVVAQSRAKRESRQVLRVLYNDNLAKLPQNGTTE